MGTNAAIGEGKLFLVANGVLEDKTFGNDG
jgi:hypothetical protein